MEENTKVDKEVIEKKDETLVVDEKNRVIDIETILSEKKEEAIVNNINNLLTCGSEYVSKEIVKEKFAQKSGNLVNEDIAMDILKEIFTELVNDINSKDAFIAIDPKTGRIDKIKSQEKLNENAEYKSSNKGESEDTFRDLFEKKNKIETDKSNSIFKTPEYREKKRKEVEDVLGKLEESEEHKEEKMNVEVTEEKVGVVIFEKYKASKKFVDGLSKDEIFLINLDRKLGKAKGTSRYEELLKQRNEFLKGKEKLEEKLIDPETGRVRKEYYKAIEASVIIGVAKELSVIKDNGIENLPEEKRKTAIRSLFAGTEIEELKEEVSKVLAEIIPGYNPSVGNTIENRIAIEKFFGMEVELHEEGWEAFVEHSIEKNVKEISERYEKISDQNVDEWFSEKSENINVGDIVREATKSDEEKFFKNSQIEFNKEDKRKFDEMYLETTAKTWINSKDTALKFRYMHLIVTKMELEKGGLNSKIARGRLGHINSELIEFTQNYPDLNYDEMLNESGEIKPVFVRAIKRFEDYRVKSKLTESFREDQGKITNYQDYDKLSIDEKKAYLKNTIVAINSENRRGLLSKTSEMNDIISKFGKRRLEILNTKEQQFIEFDKDKKIKINYDSILNEYNKISSHKFKDYEELLDYCELNQSEYIAKKLKDLEKSEESDFIHVQINGRNNKDAVEDIQRIKTINYKKQTFYNDFSDTLIGKMDKVGIDDLKLPTKSKDRLRELDEKIRNEDTTVMEFQRLQYTIETSYGNEYSDAVKQRDELIRNNPDKKSDFLECINNYSKNNIRFEIYKNNIAEKNALLTIGTINDLSKEKLKYLIENPDLKKSVLLTLVGTLDGATQETQDQLVATMQKICPNSKLTDENGKLLTDYDIISPELGKELGVENCDVFKLSELIQNSKKIMLQNEISREVDNVEQEDMVLGLEGLSEMSSMFTNAKNIIENKEEQYFKGSNIEYSDDDKENFENLYYKTLSKSWIESKEEVHKFRYMYFINNQKRLEKDPEISPERLELHKNTIRKFEEEHPDIKKEDFFLENGEIKPELQEELKEYENMKFIGDLLSDYVMDEDKVQAPEDYKKLSLTEKKMYMIRTLKGLIEENESNGVLGKLATRRLEIISNEQKNFVKKDENNNTVVDKDAVFKEYDRLFKISKTVDSPSYDTVLDIYAKGKSAHVRQRLKFYDEVTTEFKQISETDDKKRTQIIQRYKAQNSLRRALGAEEYKNFEERKKGKSNQISSEDKRSAESEKSDNIMEKSQNTQITNTGIEISEIKIPESEPKIGIKAEEVIVNMNPEQEVVQDEQNKNEEPQKSTLMDKIKNVISSFGKSNNENTNELLPVESKKGFFDNIRNAVKNLFGKEENNINTEEKIADDIQPVNEFDKRYKVEVDRSEAINKFNSGGAKEASSKVAEENKDEEVMVE